eukprot:gb/GECG01002641.1/.p1 GENE.gb/GECG01002641.1/~~gb/GECG01002641.1/.p1  ORF type:complete len:505 (+),score=64.63 gb/GECG01002641.1/:1-1515(+)
MMMLRRICAGTGRGRASTPWLLTPLQARCCTNSPVVASKKDWKHARQWGVLVSSIVGSSLTVFFLDKWYKHHEKAQEVSRRNEELQSAIRLPLETWKRSRREARKRNFYAAGWLATSCCINLDRILADIPDEKRGILLKTHSSVTDVIHLKNFFHLEAANNYMNYAQLNTKRVGEKLAHSELEKIRYDSTAPSAVRGRQYFLGASTAEFDESVLLELYGLAESELSWVKRSYHEKQDGAGVRATSKLLADVLNNQGIAAYGEGAVSASYFDSARAHMDNYLSIEDIKKNYAMLSDDNKVKILCALAEGNVLDESTAQQVDDLVKRFPLPDPFRSIVSKLMSEQDRRAHGVDELANALQRSLQIRLNQILYPCASVPTKTSLETLETTLREIFEGCEGYEEKCLLWSKACLVLNGKWFHNEGVHLALLALAIVATEISNRSGWSGSEDTDEYLRFAEECLEPKYSVGAYQRKVPPFFQGYDGILQGQGCAFQVQERKGRAALASM